MRKNNEKRVVSATLSEMADASWHSKYTLTNSSYCCFFDDTSYYNNKNNIQSKNNNKTRVVSTTLGVDAT